MHDASWTVPSPNPPASEPPLTSLDPHETSVDASHTPHQIWRHSHWQTTRDRVRAALERTGASINRVNRFDCCGDGAWVLKSNTREGVYKVSAAYCRDRWCYPCARAKAQNIARNVSRVTPKSRMRFMTLTLREDKTSLVERYRRLIACFRKLRQRTRFGELVHGGVAMIEVKHGNAADHWHVHLHVLADGQFYPCNLLSADWLAVTGDSFVTDIRQVKDPTNAIAYITKYATKPIDHQTTHHPDRLDEAIVALKGARTCFTFGSWRGTRLHERPAEDDWSPVVPLREAIIASERGEQWAVAILKSLTEQKTCRHNASLFDSS